MADFVADGGARRSVIKGVIRGRIECRRLQDARRKDDLIHRRVVIGIDGRRSHGPFGAIDRAAQLGEFAVPFELLRSSDIAEQIIGKIFNAL